MRSKGQLNQHQRAVLRWIGDGCPDGVMHGESYKITARALHHRKLVTVRRPAGRWQVTLTADGKYYLEYGALPSKPDQPIPRRQASPPPATSSAVEQPRLRDPTVDALLAKLAQGGGTFTVPDPDSRTRAAWRRTIDAARRSGQLPKGKHLTHSGRDRGDLQVFLRDGVHPVHGRAAHRAPSLDVPEEVPQLHLLLATLQDPTAVLGISSAAMPRALRLLHVLLTAAEAAGCEAGWAGAPARGLNFRSSGQYVNLELLEELDRRDVLPLPESTGGTKSYSWQRVQPQVIEAPSGRLVLTLEKGWLFTGRRHSWADRQRWRLEDKLGEVFAEIHWRLEALQERQHAKERELAQRQDNWRRAVARARVAQAEAQRVAALNEQLATWEKAKQIRSYCTALEAAGDVDDKLREWIEWARSHADAIDPAGRANLAPTVTDPQAHELAPFLPKGMSPYGPPQS